MSEKDYLQLGGVQFRRSEIKESSIKQQEGETRFIVDFKNGTKISYSKSEGGMASSSVFEFQNESEWNSTNIKNVNNLEVLGTPQKDRIQVENSTIIGIDVHGDNSADYVNIKNSSSVIGLPAISENGLGLVMSDADDDIETHNSDVR